MRGRPSPITMDVLRHLHVHGTCTRAAIVAAVGDLPQSTLSNLRYLGHVSVDHATREARYAITPRGRAKLRGDPMRRTSTDAQRLEAARRAASYLGEEVRQPSGRPGSMDAYALPSRVGNRLHWPDGRITSLTDSNPTTGERSHG